MIGKFRKKPIEVEAIRYTEENRDECIAFCGAGHTAVDEYGAVYELASLRLETPEGAMYANLGDWIIKGVAGEFYPCKPDVFELTYEAI